MAGGQKHHTGRAALVQLFMWVSYPCLVFFGLRFMPPRYVAFLMALMLLMRFRRSMSQFLGHLRRLDLIILSGLLGFCIVTGILDSELLLRCYPLAMSVGMLMLFALSLVKPPSMVERFARLQNPDLPVEGVLYTRHVTQIWCVFLMINAMISGWTALFTSQDVWALYNGFIAYLLMGALFGLEYLCRPFFVCHAGK